ncbi:MAG TPA: hypothetical protein VFZ36_01715 [Vicinamibacterales bacterium]
MRTAVVAACLFAVLGGTEAKAELRAQFTTDRAYLRFGSPTRLPGATLAPGTYLFVIGRPVGGQTIIDVYTSDGSRLVASCLAMESRLRRPSRTTTLDYAVSPSALRAWFHPANRRGVEFVYGRAEATDLSTATGLPVPYAAFTPSNRDLVGAFPVGTATPVPPIAVVNAAAIAPAATGTSGIAVLDLFNDTLGPREHLMAARRILAERASASQPHERVLLETLGIYVGRLQSAFLRNDRKGMQSARRVLEASIVNLTPDPREIAARRQEPRPRETLQALERVRAHVRAFASGAVTTYAGR